MAQARASAKFRRLVADLGGTHARFALVDAAGAVVEPAVLPVASHASPAEAAHAYLAQLGLPAAPEEAVFAVAAPLSGDEVRFTNSPWRFSADGLRRDLGARRLRLVNDFEAVAWSLPRLEAADLRQLGGGEPVAGAPRAAIGPGTGLGVAGLAPVGDGWVALASEGGHCSFAPQDAFEAEILRVLRRRFGHVSNERIVSGPGLANLHDAIAELAGDAPKALRPDQVAARAASGADPHSVEAARRFACALGSAAGDLALTLGARGGVYLGGGVVPHLGDAFDAASFRERFVAKGRMRPYLEPIPTYLILHAAPALLGAAQVVL